MFCVVCIVVVTTIEGKVEVGVYETMVVRGITRSRTEVGETCVIGSLVICVCHCMLRGTSDRGIPPF
jgi:hypothetical protein